MRTSSILALFATLLAFGANANPLDLLRRQTPDARRQNPSKNVAAIATKLSRPVLRANLTAASSSATATRSVALVEGLAVLRIGLGASCLQCASGLVEKTLSVLRRSVLHTGLFS